MEEYNRLYKIYVNKSDDEFRKIINSPRWHTKIAVEVANDILCYERKVYEAESGNDPSNGEFIDIPQKINSEASSNGGIRNYYFIQQCGILLMLITIYPVGMYFLWKNKKFDKTFKTIESVCCLAVWICVMLFAVGRISNTDELKNFQSETVLPYNFTIATEEQMAQIQDTEGLLNVINESLKKICATGETNFTFGNFENKNNNITLDAYGVTPQSKNILVSLQYISSEPEPEWTLVSVKDFDTNHYYFVMDELKNTVDLYNYNSGLLVSKKTNSLDDIQNEIAKDYEEKNKSTSSTDYKEKQTTESKSFNSTEVKKNDVQQEPIVEKTEIQTEIPHRDGMYGISDKNIRDLDSTFNVSDVRNDVTGKWRISSVAETFNIEEYALSYYNRYFTNDDQIHGIVNFNLRTTTCISVMGDTMLDVSVHEYLEDEEHDAALLFGGMLLKEYFIYLDNGDIEEVQ